MILHSAAFNELVDDIRSQLVSFDDKLKLRDEVSRRKKSLNNKRLIHSNDTYICFVTDFTANLCPEIWTTRRDRSMLGDYDTRNNVE